MILPDTCLTCISTLSALADDTVLKIVSYIYSFNTYGWASIMAIL